MEAPPQKTHAHFERIDEHIRTELLKARESIRVCVAWINWDKYSTVLLQLAERGVKIELMYNKDNSNGQILPGPAIDVFPISGIGGSALMHNKFCIIDEKVVITGSYNWSKGAVMHFENIVVIENDFRLVKAYLHTFEDLKHHYFYKRLTYIKCGCPGFRGSCRARAVHIVVLEPESEPDEVSEVHLYQICMRHLHVAHLDKRHVSHLLRNIGLIDEDHYDNETEYTRYQMRWDHNKERAIDLRLERLFASLFDIEIHAVGVVKIANEEMHYRYKEPAEFFLDFLWRHPSYRKEIPDALQDASSLDDMLERHGRHLAWRHDGG
ncbi:phospholipase D-like domain-containing protein [Burkholderia contaminans]|nr:phospholipase D-like domain-containing protein [Burkholderia contaminans]